MDKPWLAIILLDKWAREIGAATRASQKKLQKTAGKEKFANLFSAADQLLCAIKEASLDIDAGQPVAPACEPTERWPSFAEAPAEVQSGLQGAIDEVGPLSSGSSCAEDGLVSGAKCSFVRAQADALAFSAPSKSGKQGTIGEASHDGQVAICVSQQV